MPTAFWWLVLIMVVLVGLCLWRGKRRSAEELPEDALKRRYANGEIDEQTYEHMLRELRK